MMMMMRASSPVIQAPELGILQREVVFPITSYIQFPGYQANRTYGVRICYPRQLCFCQSESVESWVNESPNFRTVSQSLCVAEKEEAKAVLTPNSKKFRAEGLRAMARVSEIGSDGQPHPLLLYLLDLGFDMDQIKSVTRRHPGFAYYSLEGKIKPMVEFLLALGVNRADIPTILNKRPQLCGFSLTENLIPTMTYLENLGVDKGKWAKVIYRCPALLTYSKHKVKSTVDYLHELGLTEESIGKILTYYPSIVGPSVEENLRPTAEYFNSLGVDVAVLVHQAPQVLCLSLVENLMPKWEFFLTTDYRMSELVEFPQYFGYSLEKRIKPRYAQAKECGLKLSWNQLLTVAQPEFEKLLRRKMKKKLDELGSSMEEELTLTIPNIH